MSTLSHLFDDLKFVYQATTMLGHRKELLRFLQLFHNLSPQARVPQQRPQHAAAWSAFSHQRGVLFQQVLSHDLLQGLVPTLLCLLYLYGFLSLLLGSLIKFLRGLLIILALIVFCSQDLLLWSLLLFLLLIGLLGRLSLKFLDLDVFDLLRLLRCLFPIGFCILRFYKIR